MTTERDEARLQKLAHVREDLHVERIGICRDMEEGANTARRSAADARAHIADSRARLQMSRSLLARQA